MAERVRITGKNDGIRDNEAIDAQVDNTFNALHTKSHLYGYDGIGFTLPVQVKTNQNTNNNELLVTFEGHQCTSNTTTAQLDADESFTGSAWQDTIDYGVLSINISTDQNSAEDGLEIQWSNDGVTQTDCDCFTILANVAKTFTFGPAERYYRVKYTNGSGGATTTFHLTSLLRKCYVKPSSHRINDIIVGQDDAELSKAVLTGEDKNGNFLNIGSTAGGSLKVSMEDGQTAKRVEVDPLGNIKTTSQFLLVGTSFNGTTKDTNFWTEAVVGSGSVVQDGEINLYTGTTADSSASYVSVRKSRKVPGSANQFRAVARLKTDPQANNVRRIGAYNGTDGCYFQVNGTTFGIGTIYNSTHTVVNSGSFNGNYGASVTMDTITKRLVIDITEFSVSFFVDDILLHKVIASSGPICSTYNLPVKMENVNSGGNTTDNSFEVMFACIQRLGNPTTSGKPVFIGTNATTILKYGAGILQRVINVDNAGSVTIYDNTAASGTVISSIDTAKALGTLDFQSPFSDGLTVVTALGAKITVVYE